jgi:predicted nucleic acid-binding protein
VTLVTAAHGLIESISAIRGLVQRGDLGSEAGLTSVGWLCELDLVLDATAPRARRIWWLRERMSAYDAAYAAVAEACGAPLLSVDQRLLRACREVGIPAMSLDDLPPGGSR